MERRDFINGVLMGIGASFVPFSFFGCNFLIESKDKTNYPPLDKNNYPPFDKSNYPPLLTGMRGSHDGAFEEAHKLAWGGSIDVSKSKHLDTTEYDLVVVGAGISGLSAAHFYQKRYGPDKKILILDNHDDFGGHARRNEFNVNGKTRIGYGGSQTLEDPYSYSRAAKRLLKELQVDLGEFDTAYDRSFYKRFGLSQHTFFNKETYGEDKLIPYVFGDYSGTLVGLLGNKLEMQEGVAEMPITADAKKQLLKVLTGNHKAFDKTSAFKRMDYCNETSYIDFLKNKLNVTDPHVLQMMRLITADDWGMGTDVCSVSEAIFSGAPGLSGNDIVPLFGNGIIRRENEGGEDYIHHFPDGNASIARLLVRKLVPAVAEGGDMHDVVIANFNYDALDLKSFSTRIRLNSTVVNVKHDDDPKKSKGVNVHYIKDGKLLNVKAKHCVMACYNMMIPHLMPQLPEEQKQALKRQVKIPLVYTTVMLKNSKAIRELGIGAVFCPGNMHHQVLVDFPVSLGGYKAPSVDDPIALTMFYTPLGSTYGTPPISQFKEGRYKLLSTPFEVFEKEIKAHLNAMLGPAGFDASKDIHAITVNRWSHGYSYRGCQLHDDDMKSIAKKGRKTFGRVSIANSDAAATAYLDAAIDMAYKAVNEF